MVKSKTSEIAAYVLLGLFALSIVLPFILLLSSSLTDEIAITRNGYGFIPSVFSTDAYKYLWNSAATIGKAYLVSILVTLAGTLAGLILTVTCAYPLSRKDLPGRKVMTFFVFFTMLFNGGLVPTYLVYTQVLHIKNTIWALLVPNLLIQAYNVMLAKTFFQSSIPVECLKRRELTARPKPLFLERSFCPCPSRFLLHWDCLSASHIGMTG